MFCTLYEMKTKTKWFCDSREAEISILSATFKITVKKVKRGRRCKITGWRHQSWVFSQVPGIYFQARSRGACLCPSVWKPVALTHTSTRDLTAGMQAAALLNQGIADPRVPAGYVWAILETATKISSRSWRCGDAPRWAASPGWWCAIGTPHLLLCAGVDGPALKKSGQTLSALTAGCDLTASAWTCRGATLGIAAFP